MKNEQAVFNFQVAERSARLELPLQSPWPSVNLDSVADLVASKMMALVERGAPRDFVDIRAVCLADLVKPDQCWDLWKRRQERGGSDADFNRARLAVETHLQRIEAHRPLGGIDSAERRSEATEARRWFREEFLNAIPN